MVLKLPYQQAGHIFYKHVITYFFFLSKHHSQNSSSITCSGFQGPIGDEVKIQLRHYNKQTAFLPLAYL